MISELLLMSGNDIPFPDAQVIIHQPTIKEIAYIGETAFYMGCGFLNFSKKLLNSVDKVRLEKYDDFDIFMTMMMNRKEQSIRETIDSALLVLELIFPLYEVEVRNDRIALKREQKECYITKTNFSTFKQIIIDMFNLNLTSGEEEKYNPKGSLSQKIAEKLKRRHEQLAKLKNIDIEVNQKNINILGRYCSILAVGLQKTLPDLMQYTVYQLYDEFQRFQLKVQWDAYIQARMAGAKDLEEVDNWMIDLKSQTKKKK